MMCVYLGIIKFHSTTDVTGLYYRLDTSIIERTLNMIFYL